MAWSGKLVGGLIGGMVGGPVGAGFGATLGHLLADKDRALELVGVEWQHHGFSASGPGMWIQPVWVARGRSGREVTVRLELGDAVRQAIVEPEEEVEECHVPRFFIPYERIGGETTAVVRLRSEGVAKDEAAFDVELPNEVRRMGGNGPARAVMALVACARAGGRALTKEDVRYIRDSFQEGQELDDDGVAWLKAWVRELRDADVSRLTAPKVARRLTAHLDADGRERMFAWLLRGPWPQGEWIEELAQALGVDLDAVRQRLEDGPDPWELLGIARGAPMEEARAAYHKLVLRWHPDRAGPGELEAFTKRMAEINAAWRRVQG